MISAEVDPSLKGMQGVVGGRVMNNSKKSRVLLLVILMFASVGTVFAETPLEGGVLPDFSLPVPEKESYREYLGVEKNREFRITEINADVVIIQIFSMY